MWNQKLNGVPLRPKGFFFLHEIKQLSLVQVVAYLLEVMAGHDTKLVENHQ